MNECVSFFFSGQVEGVVLVLQSLSEKDGYEDMTKEYVIQKLTDLNLTDFIEPIIAEFYTPTAK